jgi:hypothetical protein
VQQPATGEVFTECAHFDWRAPGAAVDLPALKDWEAVI